MPDFSITIDVYVLLLLICLAAALGFAGRSRQLAKKNRRISELEQEMVRAHAELLSQQHEYCELEVKVKDAISPVIAMKNNKPEEPPQKPADHKDRLRTNRPTGTD